MNNSPDSSSNSDQLLGRILVVDDLPANVRLLEGILKVAGYEVETAPDGARALEFISATPPDVVLLDIMMPDMDGFEVCRRIKSNPETSWLPVVMVTALQETADRVAALQAGADDFLTKPVDEVEVVARVQSLVRVKRQREDLENAYRDLRKAESMREGLSAMLVHDLRTPLTAILGSLQMLGQSEPTDVQRELIEICARSSGRLLGLINDLLDVSKMENGEMRLERSPIALAELIDDAFNHVLPGSGSTRVAPTGRSVEVQIQVPDDLPTLMADRDLLGRILINLLGNAARYIPRDGHIAVEVQSAPSDSDAGGVLFSIRDNGPGIASEYQTRIFEKFTQVETAQSGRKLSTGLGLTFCKLAVEAHGGKIWVESTPGEGSDFRFTIPRNAQA